MMAGLDQAPDHIDDFAGWHRTGIAPAIRNDAKRAAMIAAVLDLDISPRAAIHAIDQMPCGFLDRFPRFGLHFLVIADHPCDFRHFSKHVGIYLRRASGDDNRGAGIVLGGAANGLPRGPRGFGRDGACVDNHRALQPGLFGMTAHDLALIAVEATAKRNDLRGPGRGFGLRHD